MRILVKNPSPTGCSSALIHRKSQWNASFPQVPAAFGSVSSFPQLPENLSRGADQTQLTISEPGDPLEQEADRLADQAVPPGWSHASAEYDHPDGGVRRETPATESSGSVSGLKPAERRFFEARFHHSFADVRVHADGEAGESARLLHARAYTLGSQIFFAPRQYQPGTTAGRHLLAHELSHVIQQERMRSPGASTIQRSPDDEKTAQKTLSEEGVSAGDPVAKKTAGIIDAVFQRNKTLAPYIGDRLKKVTIAEKGKFVQDLNDGEFENSYRNAYGLNSSDSVPKQYVGFYDPKTSEVHLRPGAEFGTAFHEAVHKLASPALYSNYLKEAMKISNDLAEVLKEGVTALFADSILNDEGLPDLKDGYRSKKKKAKDIENALGSDGFDVLARFNFKGNIIKMGEKLGFKQQQMSVQGILEKLNKLI
jgi:hypothetical protein